jgi:signal transduction histidine kinase/PAS domain-containing protein
MFLSLPPFPILLLLVAGAATLAIAVVGFARRDAPGGGIFFLLMLACTHWSWGFALELWTSDIATKLLWARIEYFGFVSVPVLWLIFTARYTRRDGWLSRPRVAMLWVVPLLALAAVFTNERHGLIWRQIDFPQPGSSGLLIYHHGPGFFILIAYSYLLIAASMYLLAQSATGAPAHLRRQAVSMMVGGLAPWVGNLLYLANLSPIPGFDLTGLGFAVTGLFGSWAMFGVHFMEAVPIARNQLIESLEDSVLVVDAGGRIVDMNPSGCASIGHGSAHLGERAESVLDCWPQIKSCLKRDGPSQMEIVFGERAHEMRVLPLNDARRSFLGWLIIFRDISLRRQAELALDIQVSTMTSLYQTSLEINSRREMPELLGVIEACTAQLLGVTEASVQLLAPSGGLESWSGPQGCEELFAEVVERGELVQHPTRQITADVPADISEHWCLGVPLLTAGHCLGAILMCDTTRTAPFGDGQLSIARLFADQAALAIENSRLYEVQRGAGLALVTLNDSLQVENAELDAFAHTVAHDLKNPVSWLMGYSELLSDGWRAFAPADLTSALSDIYLSSVKLDSIIDELLLLAQVRKGEVERVPLDMYAIVGNAVQRLAPLLSESGARVRQPPLDAWPVACGHAAWVEEVWVNYISNAAKYGGLPPIIELGSDVIDADHASFWVRDNGHGLTAEQQERLFTPFERIGQVRATGFGLGLSIVRRIIYKLGGTVHVQSSPGKGSTFSFVLPLAASERVESDDYSMVRGNEVKSR